ncbi:zinc finger protein 699-like [Condylostylus longicornis]|uniref:zinc finger protein 699-like n=1 Tax=Condylostylus longicornis TaxID=2530218 RepID=UPI00244DE2E3|nr:zinc finger protein 699-like [Condylostylus longicornis]
MANFEPIPHENFSAKDIDIVCRICLLHKQILYSIFDHDIDKILLAIVRFPITKNDGYPHQICSKCYKDVVTAYRFKRQCEYAYNIVKSVLKTSEISCNKCSTNFCSNSNLKRHLKNIHRIDWNIGTPLPNVSNVIQNAHSSSFNEEDNIGEIAKKHDGYVYEENKLFVDPVVENNVVENCTNTTLDIKAKVAKYEISEASEIDIENSEINANISFIPTKKPTFKELILSKFDKNEVNIQILNYLDLMPVDNRAEYENLAQQKRDQTKRAYEILRKVGRSKTRALITKNKVALKFSENEKFECLECKKKVENAEDFRRHQLSHAEEPKPYACGMCSKLFSHLDYLKYHLKEFHQNVKLDQSFQCYICKRLHTCSSDLSDHINICLGEKRIFSKQPLFQIKEKECKEDTVVYSNPSDGNSNQVQHNFDKFNYQSFKNEAYYSKAQNLNGESIQYSKSSFKSGNENPLHSREETKSREFFKNLSDHSVLELITKKIQSIKRNDNGKFECELCQKEFNRRAHVKRHYLTHSTAKPFACKFCSSRFSCAEYLQTHMSRVHWVKNFQSIKNKPRESSNSQCFTPHETVVRRRRMIDVIKTSDGKYQCKFCQRLFSRSDHVRRHEVIHSPKSFKCTLCPRKFSTPDNLKKHLVTCIAKKDLEAQDYQRLLSTGWKPSKILKDSKK